MAAPLQRSGEYDIFLKIVLCSAVDLQDSGDELMLTNIRIPLPRRTCRTGHQPGFSRPPSMVVRRAEGRCGSKGISPPQSGVLQCAKHNHLAPHSFTRVGGTGNSNVIPNFTHKYTFYINKL